LEDIKKYPLDRFMMFLDAEDQRAASERVALLTDLGVLVGSMYTEKGEDAPMAEHIGLLLDTARGVKEWLPKPNSMSESRSQTNSPPP
jgi:hypothetical protein